MNSTRKNTKGMTLIEIIVVLLLSTVLMVIAGGLLLNSTGYFNKTAQSNYEKQAVDAISSYVRNQLVYATEVQISTTKPDDSKDWHWLSIDSKNQLTRDDEEIYNNGFYRERNLKITTKQYDDLYRLDLAFSFTDNDDKQLYRTSSTLELVNLKAKYKDKNNAKNKGILGTSVTISDASNIEGETSGYKIYFKVNGALEIKDDPDIPSPDIDYDDPAYEGTVYDELKCRNPEENEGNNKGIWQENESYQEGDFVDYLGVTYRAVKDIENGNNPKDNNGNGWKPINPPYWVEGASYKEDDVILYNGKYYQAEDDINNSNKHPSLDGNNWKELNDSELNEIIEEHKSENFCKIDGNENEDCDADRPYKTVGDELCERSSTITAPDKGTSGNREDGWTNNKGDFEENLKNFSPNHEQRFYRKGDFVTLNGETWRLLGDYADITQEPPSAWWKIIQEEWDARSYYENGDVVKYNEAYYINIYNTVTFPNNAPDGAAAWNFWKKVKKDPNGTGWIDA